MVETDLVEFFPGLRGKSCQITSPRDDRYNCIAFAAGDLHHWWWPDQAGQDAWPAGVERVETIDAFCSAFSTLGYAICEGDHLEAGYEKVALFAHAGVPKHASRQLQDELWASKLGPSEDIVHSLRDLEGTIYGTVVLIMKRPTANGD